MAVTTYMDIIEQMKALAEKINKHYDSVTLETEIPIEDETSRILREAGIVEDNDDETSEDESTVAEETEAQSDEEETIEEIESTEDDEEDRIEEELSAAQKKLPAGLRDAIAKKQGDSVEEDDSDDDSKEEVDEAMGQDKFQEFAYDPSRWSEEVIEDTLASMDSVAWDPKAGTLTANEGPALDALTALVKANVGINQEFSGEHGLAQARRVGGPAEESVDGMTDLRHMLNRLIKKQ
jgi:hypothetical protein|tara:strand:+ start:121 stop:831 length:711 start_codon:yes stop_codon:yes gene_type:complete